LEAVPAIFWEHHTDPAIIIAHNFQTGNLPNSVWLVGMRGWAITRAVACWGIEQIAYRRSGL